jgi:archaea-specific RecJ-like exonuclease
MKKKEKHHKNHKGHKAPSRDFKVKELRIEEITPALVGRNAIIYGIVERIIQTTGPTLFVVSDGTGTFVLKGFGGKGARVFPEINEGDPIKSLVEIREFNNALEGEVATLEALSDKEAEEFMRKTKEVEREKAKPEDVEFLVKAPVLEKLKDRFIKAATEIKLAIVQNRPIIVRHHNDTDGYSAGYALEKPIVALIEKQHGPGKAPWEYYTRSPCSAPFYEIDDSIRDTSFALSDAAKFSNKMPLVIIADNGSSSQDLFGIKQGKVHGIDFIVIDHHYFDEDVISQEVLVHINPFLVGEDGAKFSAGMLCTELARFITKVDNIEFIAALAGLADRINYPEAMEKYFELAEKSGYSRELLSDISTTVDFVSAKLRFLEAREYIEVLFGEPHDRQKALVTLMAPYIRELEAKGLEMAKSAAAVAKVGKTNLQRVDIEQNFPGFGFYPKPGKTVGLLHDYLKQQQEAQPIVTIGVMNSAITIRATDEADFSVHDLIEFLRERIPSAFVEGGGHKNAGSINFIPSKQKEVLALFDEFLKSR